uniref:Uncharacterized protein n=1 Tax=Eptatretus burgeri TaxID=7764 RepID=A0A8C4R6B8_EPTBU
MNRKQLKKALHRAGYTIISGLEEQVIRQYFDVRNGMHFDDFICCLLHLEALSEAFKLLTRGEMGYPAEREWVKTILFC